MLNTNVLLIQFGMGYAFTLSVILALTGLIFSVWVVDKVSLFFFHQLTLKTITAQLGKYAAMQVYFHFKAPLWSNPESTEKINYNWREQSNNIQALFSNFDKIKAFLFNYL